MVDRQCVGCPFEGTGECLPEDDCCLTAEAAEEVRQQDRVLLSVFDPDELVEIIDGPDELGGAAELMLV